jgi:mono/diheme cytochrome c family protein
MRAETPTDFYLAVTEGRGEMPGYTDTLNSDERWDVVFYVWRLSTTADTLVSGQRIYAQNCASCHGETGAGDLIGSADLTNLRAMADLTSQSLFLTITQGRGSMPAWQSLLSQDERWAVIDYVRTFTYDPTLEAEVVLAPTSSAPEEPTEIAGCQPDQSNPFAWDDISAIQAGEPIYEAQCALCHGADGSGALPNAPDFTSTEVNAEFIGNPGVYFCSLTEGKGAMPAYGDSLSVEERWQVLTLIGSLVP